MPEAARQALRALHGRFRALEEETATLEEEETATLEKAITSHARRDETARRLATIAGAGRITVFLIATTVIDIGLFNSARHFAAWLGLVPRQFSTGGKTRLGRITKAGNGAIRTSLFMGATSMVARAGQWDSATGAWLRSVLAPVTTSPPTVRSSTSAPGWRTRGGRIWTGGFLPHENNAPMAFPSGRSHGHLPRCGNRLRRRQLGT